MKKTDSSNTIQGKMTKNISDTINALEDSIRSDQSKKNRRASSQNHHGDNGPPQNNIYTYEHHGSKQRIIWSTVGLLAFLIIGLWSWHMRTVFYDAARGTYNTATPLDAVGTYFDEAMIVAGRGDEANTPPAALTNILTETTTQATSTHQVQTTPTLDALITSLEAQVTTSTTVTSSTL